VFAKHLSLSALVTLATLASVPCEARDSVGANICAQVTQKDTTHHTIPRAAVSEALGAVRLLSHSTRLIPETKNGTVLGYRISSLRKGSLAGCLGFKNGDVVQAINDVDVTIPDMAMHNFAKLLGPGVVHCSVLRGREPILLELTIE